MAWQTPKTNWQAADVVSKDDFNRIEGNIQHLQDTKETPAGAQAKVDTHAGSKQTHGISSGYYIAKTSRSDQLPAWNDIQGKPNLALAAHTHSGSDIISAVANANNADTVDGKHADQITDYNAGEVPLREHGTNFNSSSSLPSADTWHMRESIRIYKGGTLRIKFGLCVKDSGTIYGRIYRNGTPIGTTRSTTSTTPVFFTEDIVGWSPGDTVELWMMVTPGIGIKVATSQPMLGIYVDKFDGISVVK